MSARPAANRDVAVTRSMTLSQRVGDPGFTPRLRDLDALVDLLADDDVVKAAERAIARIGAAALPLLRSRFETAEAPLRARILRALGRLAATRDRPAAKAARADVSDCAARTDVAAEAASVLLEALDDADPKTRRNAAISLGHVAGDDVEEALLAAWTHDDRPEMRRSLAASLGKIGSKRALGLLRQAADDPEPELRRIAERAVLMIERTASRTEAPAFIDPAPASPDPVAVRLLARAGLEELLLDELTGSRAVDQLRIDAAAAPGEAGVLARLVGPLQRLFAARTMLAIRFPLAPEPLGAGEHVADAVGRALTSIESRNVLRTWAPAGDVRYRLAWADGAHRRAATWEVVRRLATLAPDLVNDPTASDWEVLVTQRPAAVDVSLAPRRLRDPRFAWRVADVPAASHPTIAAALARVGGSRPDDVVWDPFVGSGAELVERALLGPYRELRGTDVDAGALAAARLNLAAAHVDAALELHDALTYEPPHRVTLIVTNPPMGRRASREHGLADRLDRFVERSASLLAPRGRLVWVAPWPQRARAAGERARLSLAWARTLDMGGFDAEMQLWTKGER